ncbi:TetR/AcrR family transcriptional regulator [Roseateles sp. UC29_93]|uniref:TetR/AcrR family transcriptional regulator n=1 Tax=Roseateles TaxID=93681 RepID=UPI00366FC266
MSSKSHTQAADAGAAKTDTREELLAAARLAVQAHGYNALSFRELAKEVGIKSASVHYYFPTKGDLAAALAGRYADEAEAFLGELGASGMPHDDLMRAYAGAFRVALENDNRMCLCGIMTAEYDDLPAQARTEVDRFAQINAEWLAATLRPRHRKAPPAELEQRAVAIFAAIEGAQLIARGRKDVGAFDRIIDTYRSVGLFS